MAAITPVASKVRPLQGAIMRRFPAGSTSIAPGSWVYVDSAGKIQLADNNDTVTKAQVRGLVIGVGVDGKVAAAVGDQCDVCVFGPVEIGVTGLTDGAVLYISATAGKADQTASAVQGEFNTVVGWAESDNVIFVAPQVTIPVAVP